MSKKIKLLKEKYRLSNVKAIAANGDTILHSVVKDESLTEQETIEILGILLDKGLDPNSSNKKKETVLHLAIKNRARDAIDFLLERKVGLDISSTTLYLIENEHNKLLGWRRLWPRISDEKMQEEESKSASFLEWMMTRGLNIDRKSRDRRGDMFLAVDYDLQHLLPILLKYTNSINYVEYTSGRTLLNIILGHESKTPCRSSYRRRYVSSVVKVLLDRGVSPEAVDASWNTALHLAIKNYDSMKVVQMLIDHTTNFNLKNKVGETPFLIAIREGLGRKERNIADDYRTICQILIMKGADVSEGNNSGSRPLHIFAEQTRYRQYLDEEDIELLEMLIRIGGNVNAKNSRGETPLHLAAAGRKVAVVREPTENDGATPLNCTATRKETFAEITDVLIKHGANVNAKDCEGLTPLHEAAGNQESYSDDSATLKLLLENGADFITPSGEGYSVLHMSVCKFYNIRLFANTSYFGAPLLLHELASSDFFHQYHNLSIELGFLMKHWVRLYAAGLECDVGSPFKAEQIPNGLAYYPESRRVYQDCTEEIEIMKNTFIDNNHTSIDAFLHMNLNSRRAHIHNKKLQQLVHSPSQLEEQFPQYAILIISAYNETIRRTLLMGSARIAWIELTQTKLGDLCIEHIFSFLRNADLQDLSEAFGIDYFR